MGRRSRSGRGKRGRRKGRSGKKNPYSSPDRFSQQAHEEGYVARSVYKLQEIHRRFPIFRRGQRVVDLGCAPGSWLTWTAEQIGPRGTLVGVDIDEPEVSAGTLLVRSVFEVTADELREALGGPADVVLSDMAPRTIGDALADHVRQLELAQRAVDLALELLAPGGDLVVKVFDGEDAHAFVQAVRPHFDKVKRLRPEAVRRNSREFFLVGLGSQPS